MDKEIKESIKEEKIERNIIYLFDSLMPCPFCRGEAISEKLVSNNISWYSISCFKCKCALPLTKTLYESIILWNNRRRND